MAHQDVVHIMWTTSSSIGFPGGVSPGGVLPLPETSATTTTLVFAVLVTLFPESGTVFLANLVYLVLLNLGVFFGFVSCVLDFIFLAPTVELFCITLSWLLRGHGVFSC
jgi:hypothetical protein